MLAEHKIAPLRAALAGLLVGWLANPSYRFSYLNGVMTTPLSDDFFPEPLQSTALLLASYVLGLAVIVGALTYPRGHLGRLSAYVVAACSLFQVLHQRSFFWQTCITSFWTSLWMIWLVRSRSSHEDTGRVGAALSLLLISFTFLGAAVGKCTPGYWSGEALYYMLYLYQAGDKYAFLREVLSDEQLRMIALIHSRFAVFGEWCIAALMLLPAKVGLALAFTSIIAMWATSPASILDALSPLIGLAFGGLLLARASTPATPLGETACG